MENTREQDRVCENCKGLLTYINQYDRWYCYHCEMYSEPHKPTEPEKQESYHSEPKSKKNAKIAAVFVALILVIASIAYILMQKSPEKEKELISIYDVSEIRELDVIEDVPIRYVKQDELSEFLSDSLTEEDLEDLEETRLLFYSLFLLDYEENLTQILVDAYVSEGMGFYDPANEEIVMVSGFSSVMDRVTLSHEFTHALQDQHFDLTAFQESVTGDEELARSAVFEGDATLTMSLYMLTLSEKEIQDLLKETSELSGSSNDIPFVIQEMMMFPYEYGLQFVQALYMDGGWTSVNAAYTNPPTTTEQVMHVEKYASHEPPVTVTFDSEVENMTLIVNDTVGEFMIYLMLDNYLSADRAWNGADGWGGDRFYYYRNETDFLSVFKIYWDDRLEAGEFYNIYEEWIDSLPSEYDDIISEDRLQIEIEQLWWSDVTTIYYSSDAQIINNLR